MKKLVIAAVVVLVWLQYAHWFGTSGYFQQKQLSDQLADKREKIVVLERRNQILTAQVLALAKDPKVLEARARHDLGLVKSGEVFFLVPDRQL